MQHWNWMHYVVVKAGGGLLHGLTVVPFVCCLLHVEESGTNWVHVDLSKGTQHCRSGVNTTWGPGLVYAHICFPKRPWAGILRGTQVIARWKRCSCDCKGIDTGIKGICPPCFHGHQMQHIDDASCNLESTL